MGFINPNKIGVLEKAAKIAVKYGVTYDAREKMFKGDPMSVDKASAALLAWQTVQDDRLRHERRQESW